MEEDETLDWKTDKGYYARDITVCTDTGLKKRKGNGDRCTCYRVGHEQATSLGFCWVCLIDGVLRLTCLVV